MINDGFRDYSSRVRPLVEGLLRKELAAIFCVPTAGICSSLLDALQAGKKLRGCLTCLVAETLGGDLQAALPRAVSIELIQAATLIHDDFVDQDTVRRNKPALWTLEGSRRAVLIGDVIFASAISMMNDIGREDGLVISRAIAEISRGALFEPLEPSNIEAYLRSGQSSGLYEEIIRLKTGILFASCCQLGALAAGGATEMQAGLYRFGLRLGEAYQIADDLKDVKECALTGVSSSRQLVALAPAIMRFASESSRLEMGAMLTGGRKSISEEALSLSVLCMKEEIERRLDMAIHEIDCSEAIDGVCAERMQRASWDIIEMFNES